MPGLRESGEGPEIEPIWTYTLPTGLGTHYSAACARFGTETTIALPGQPLGEPGGESGIFLLDQNGRLRARSHEVGAISPFSAILDAPEGPSIAYWAGREEPRAKLVRASDCSRIWSRSHPWTGNGDFLEGDFNHDGREEIIYSVGGLKHYIVCADLATGEELWRYADRVTVCWGRLAAADIDLDGEFEIVFGTEYGNQDGTSSIVALSPDGSVKWRRDDIIGDAGSTPAVLADVNGDGLLEVLKVEIDLCGRDGHISTIVCTDAFGSPLYSLQFGGTSVAVADVDGDGALEALGLTSERDGGAHGRREMVCFDLSEPDHKWVAKVPRAYLSGDPVVADMSGEEGLETLVTTGMPSGYGRIPGRKPWGKVYLFSSSGELVWMEDFPDWACDPLACDLDGDGMNEFLIPSYEGRLCAWKTPGRAKALDFRKANGGPLRLGQPSGAFTS